MYLFILLSLYSRMRTTFLYLLLFCHYIPHCKDHRESTWQQMINIKANISNIITINLVLYSSWQSVKVYDQFGRHIIRKLTLNHALLMIPLILRHLFLWLYILFSNVACCWCLIKKTKNTLFFFFVHQYNMTSTDHNTLIIKQSVFVKPQLLLEVWLP